MRIFLAKAGTESLGTDFMCVCVAGMSCSAKFAIEVNGRECKTGLYIDVTRSLKFRQLQLQVISAIAQ